MSMVISKSCSIAGSIASVCSGIDLVKGIEELREINKRLILENYVYERYLQRSDPALLQTMNQVLDFANKIQVVSNTMSTTLEPTPSFAGGVNCSESTTSTQRAHSPNRSRVGTSIFSGFGGPKINMNYRIEMVTKEMEELQQSLDDLEKKSTIIRAKLTAQLEEIGQKMKETVQIISQFENDIVIGSVDPVTQRIPAEKFIRFIEEWLRTTEIYIGKLRLRTSTLKTHYLKSKQLLIQKEQLGESLHPVDFEQVKIENQEFIEKLEIKNRYLIELKTMTGHANLALTTHKQFLQQQIKEFNSVKNTVAEKEKQIAAMQEMKKNVQKEVDKETDKLNNIKDLRENYTVPDMIDYVKKKAELRELRKAIKIWERRKKIQQIAVNSCVLQMKKLTSSEEIVKNWFKMPERLTEKDSNEVLGDIAKDYEEMRQLYAKAPSLIQDKKEQETKDKQETKSKDGDEDDEFYT